MNKLFGITAVASFIGVILVAGALDFDTIPFSVGVIYMALCVACFGISTTYLTRRK